MNCAGAFDPQGMIGFGIAVSGVAFAIAWVKVARMKLEISK